MNIPLLDWMANNPTVVQCSLPVVLAIVSALYVGRQPPLTPPRKMNEKRYHDFLTDTTELHFFCDNYRNAVIANVPFSMVSALMSYVDASYSWAILFVCVFMASIRFGEVFGFRVWGQQGKVHHAQSDSHIVRNYWQVANMVLPGMHAAVVAVHLYTDSAVTMESHAFLVHVCMPCFMGLLNRTTTRDMIMSRLVNFLIIMGCWHYRPHDMAVGSANHIKTTILGLSLWCLFIHQA